MIVASKFIAILGAFGIFSLAIPADAAPKMEPRVPTWEQSHFAEGNVAVRAIYILAVCARNHRLAQVEAMLRAAPGSPEERAAIPLVPPPAYDECLYRTRELKIRNLNILRGALAEAIYNGRGAHPRSDQPLPFDLKAKVPVNPNQPVNAASPRMVAACAVQQSPGRTHEVLQHNAGSFTEQRALRALNPLLEACLPPGAKLQATSLAMRAAIGEALYFAWRAQPELFESK
jgi:hypothetical protein